MGFSTKFVSLAKCLLANNGQQELSKLIGDIIDQLDSINRTLSLHHHHHRSSEAVNENVKEKEEEKEEEEAKEYFDQEKKIELMQELANVLKGVLARKIDAIIDESIERIRR